MSRQAFLVGELDVSVSPPVLLGTLIVAWLRKGGTDGSPVEDALMAAASWIEAGDV